MYNITINETNEFVGPGIRMGLRGIWYAGFCTAVSIALTHYPVRYSGADERHRGSYGHADPWFLMLLGHAYGPE
jgi:hypothetical protein